MFATFTATYKANNHDDSSEWHISWTLAWRTVIGNHLSKGDDLRYSEILVAAENTEDESDDKGDAASVRVGWREIENKEKLGEEDDIGEVSTQDTWMKRNKNNNNSCLKFGIYIIGNRPSEYVLTARSNCFALTKELWSASTFCEELDILTNCH